MSGINVDLRGDWRRDADISFNVRKGGANVSLPDDVVIEGLDSQPGVNVSSRDEDPEIALPRLRFSITVDDDSEVEFN